MCWRVLGSFLHVVKQGWSGLIWTLTRWRLPATCDVAPARDVGFMFTVVISEPEPEVCATARRVVVMYGFGVDAMVWFTAPHCVLQKSSEQHIGGHLEFLKAVTKAEHAWQKVKQKVQVFSIKTKVKNRVTFWIKYNLVWYISRKPCETRSLTTKVVFIYKLTN